MVIVTMIIYGTLHLWSVFTEIKDGTRKGETLTTIKSGGVREPKWKSLLDNRDRGEAVVDRRTSRY